MSYLTSGQSVRLNDESQNRRKKSSESDFMIFVSRPAILYLTGSSVVSRSGYVARGTEMLRCAQHDKSARALAKAREANAEMLRCAQHDKEGRSA
jgi:hypothetical protein